MDSTLAALVANGSPGSMFGLVAAGSADSLYDFGRALQVRGGCC